MTLRIIQYIDWEIDYSFRPLVVKEKEPLKTKSVEMTDERAFYFQCLAEEDKIEIIDVFLSWKPLSDWYIYP